MTRDSLPEVKKILLNLFVGEKAQGRTEEEMPLETLDLLLTHIAGLLAVSEVT